MSSTTTPTRYISARNLSARLDISETTLWRWAKSGRIPTPQKLGENTSRWDLDAVLSALAAASGKKGGEL